MRLRCFAPAATFALVASTLAGAARPARAAVLRFDFTGTVTSVNNPERGTRGCAFFVE